MPEALFPHLPGTNPCLAPTPKSPEPGTARLSASLAAVIVGATRRSTPTTAGSPPYTASEVDGFDEAAAAQATARQQAVLEVMLAFGLGAGLRTGELIDLTGGQVTPHRRLPGVVVVELGDRTVPVRRDRTTAVLRIAERVGDGLVLPGKRTHMDPLGHARRGTTLPGWLPRLTMSRLRTTWMVALLNDRMPLLEFLTISGMKSSHTLSILASHVPPRGDDSWHQIAAGVDPVGSAVAR